MNIEEMKQRLKAVNSINLSAHVKLKATIRKEISEEELVRRLKSLDGMVYCQYQGREYECDKYALIFDKSNKYDLRIIVSIKENSLTIVTAHVQNKKKRQRLERWLKR